MSAESSSSRSRTRDKPGVSFEVDFSEVDNSDFEGVKRVTLHRDTDPAFRNAITVSEPDGYDYDVEPPRLPIPSSGERYDDCGDEVPALFCTDCGSPIEVGRTCRRSRCPRCWQSWCFHLAREHAAALDGLKRYRRSRGESAKIHHITVSLRDSISFRTEYPLVKIREVTKTLMDHIGVSDGYIRYHPWRIRDEYRGDVNGHESGDGDMTWADILRISQVTDWADVRDEYLYHSPHVHVIGVSNFAQGGLVSEKIEEETGTVVHRITKGPDSPVSVKGVEDVCGVSAYSLSHSGVWQDENGDYQVASWAFGEVANFSAAPNVYDDVDEAMREVAPDVLGMDFSKPTCSAEVIDEDQLHDIPDHNTNLDDPGGDLDGDLGGTAPDDLDDDHGDYPAWGDDDAWAETRGVVPDFATEPPTDWCGGSLTTMQAAEKYLNDDEWVQDADHVDDLRDAFKRWREQGEPEPEPVA